MPISLDDDQMQAILDAAAPIAVEKREAFLREIASALQGCVEIGAGNVHRAIAEIQRRHFDPPDLSRALGTSKYRG